MNKYSREKDKQDPLSKKFVAHCIFVLCLSGDKACGMLIDLSHLRVFDRKDRIAKIKFKAMLSGVDACARF